MHSTVDLPRRFAGAKLADYRPSTPSQGKALAAAQAFVDGGSASLVISGPTGVGKTHLAAAIANAVSTNIYTALEARQAELDAEHGGRVVAAVEPYPQWLNVADAIAGMRLEMDLPFDDRDDTARLLRARTYRGIVILDDLGREKVSDWTGEQVYALVNTRYEALLRTIVTTNLTGPELAASPYWPIISRLAEDGALVRIEAKDYRLVKNGRRLADPDEPSVLPAW